LGYRDDLLIVAEPYRLFAIEAPAAAAGHLRFADADQGIVLTDDVTPFRERKLRILNGGHTILASIALLIGCETVLDAMRHPLIEKYLHRLLFDEIVPSVDAPDAKAFAHDVLARLANPYLRHALRDITLQHTAKLRLRVVPSILRAAERTGGAAPGLAFGFAAYLQLLRSPPAGVSLGVDAEGERIRSLWRAVGNESEAALHGLVRDASRDVQLWRTDLSRIPGFVDLAGEQLVQIARFGAAAALASHLGEHVARSGSPYLSSKS
jgi:tagaturonate reductase